MKGGVLDSSLQIEKETLSNYKMEDYHPVEIGELFHDRYRVIGKLGCGLASTVWLCHDLHSKLKNHIALKVYIHNSKLHRELSIYKPINNLASSHEDRHRVRRLLDDFELKDLMGRTPVLSTRRWV
jgi:hypothetical protein